MLLPGSRRRSLHGTDRNGPQRTATHTLRSVCGPNPHEQPRTRANSTPRGSAFSGVFVPVRFPSRITNQSGQRLRLAFLSHFSEFCDPFAVLQATSVPASLDLRPGVPSHTSRSTRRSGVKRRASIAAAGSPGVRLGPRRCAQPSAHRRPVRRNAAASHSPSGRGRSRRTRCARCYRAADGCAPSAPAVPGRPRARSGRFAGDGAAFVGAVFFGLVALTARV
jgi:hypothetical protein